MIELNDLAFQNADVLEAIDAAPNEQLTIAGLAAQIDRDPANLRKTLKRLTAEGLLQEPALAGLTDAGEEQLRAIRRARSASDQTGDAGQSRWPLGDIVANPFNRPIDPATLPDLADSIVGAEDVIQPVVLTPVQDDGKRMLLAGERRWRASLLLREEQRLPEGMQDSIPFVERDVSETQALLIMAIENNQREDVSPWEDARLLGRLAEALGGNATEVARRTGRLKETNGKRAGLRDVQWKIKVAKEATPEAVHAYEADPVAPGAWERLRDSVTRPQGPANPHLALFIVEAALKSEAASTLWDGELTLPVGLQWPEGWQGKWFHYNRDNGRFKLMGAACDWLAGEGLGEDDADSVLVRVRSRAGLPHRDGREPWVSEVLNPSAAAAANPGAEGAPASPTNDAADPCVYNGVRYPNATRAGEARRVAEGARIHVAPPTRPAAAPDAADRPQLALSPAASAADDRPQLTPRQTCALVELAHKTHACGFEMDGGQRAVTVGKFWLSSLANDLVHARLIRFVQMPAKPPLAVITERGAAWLIGGAHAHGDDLKVTPVALQDIQRAAYDRPGDYAYATDWIAEEVAPAGVLPEGEAAGQTDVEDAANAAAAADLLREARRFIADGAVGDPFYRHELARLLDGVHAAGPVRADQDGAVVNARDEVLFTYDQHADLPGDVAQAGAELTAHLINVAVAGRLIASNPRDLEDGPQPGESLVARVARTGEAIQHLMLRHYEALSADAEMAQAYSQFVDVLRHARALADRETFADGAAA